MKSASFLVDLVTAPRYFVPQRFVTPFTGRCTLTILLTCMALGVHPVKASEGPFDPFAGTWSGAGTVTVKDGSKERLKCRASYQVTGAGAALAQDLTCASDSYTFNVISHVAAQGGVINGTWAETSRGADGQISGRIEGKRISASVAGLGFQAGIAITAYGRKQFVQIRPTGTDITDVTLTMSRR